jgi:hypothetical protein
VKSKRGHRHGKGPAPEVGDYVKNGPQMASINLSPLGRLGRFRTATLGSMAVKQGYL